MEIRSVLWVQQAQPADSTQVESGGGGGGGLNPRGVPKLVSNSIGDPTLKESWGT